MSSRDPRVRLVDIRQEPLNIDEVLAAVDDPAAGGVGLFVGVVRDHDGGRGVQGLGYSAHPSAVEVMSQVATDRLDDDVIAVAAVHRVGDLDVGDVAVITAVSAAHRGVALTRNAEFIDEIKSTVPVWKHQRFLDGSDEWVGLT